MAIAKILYVSKRGYIVPLGTSPREAMHQVTSPCLDKSTTAMKNVDRYQGLKHTKGDTALIHAQSLCIKCSVLLH